MFHQITKKIITLVTTVCLLVGMMVVPSAAADDTQMYLYNGIELPPLPLRDENVYPYVYVCYLNSLINSKDGYYVWFTHRPLYSYNSGEDYYLCFHGESAVNYVRYRVVDSVWVFDYESSLGGSDQVYDLLWSNEDVYLMNHDSENTDVYEETNSLVLAASVPVPVIDDLPIYDDIPVDNGPPVVEAVPDSESIIEVLNSILEYDVATWNLLAYGTNRIRYIERYVADIREALLKFVPSEQETTLKEATSDVTAAYTETFWSDSGGGFGRSDIEDTGFILQNSKDMFDTGLSVSDFFSLFGTYGWGNWFSAETRDDLDTVPKPAVIDDGEDSELSTYEKNLQEIQSFVGGG